MGPLTTIATLLILDKAEYLARSIRTHMKAAAVKLVEVFSLLPPRGEGEPPWPEWLSVQEANLIQLEQATVTAHQASQAYLAAKTLVTTTLFKRNDLVKNLRQYYQNLRGSARATYNEGALHLLGLVDPASRRFLAFREQCLFVARCLRVPDLIDKLGSPVAGQPPLNLEANAASFSTAVSNIESVMADITEYRKLRDKALIAKREAEDQLRVVTINVARVQEGYYRMAGLDEEANRIRLTIPQSKPKSPQQTQPPEENQPVEESQPTA